MASTDKHLDNTLLSILSTTFVCCSHSQCIAMLSDSPGKRPRAIHAPRTDATRTLKPANAPTADSCDISGDIDDTIDPSQGMAKLYALFQEQIRHTVTHLAATHAWLGFHRPRGALHPDSPASKTSPSLLHYCQQTDSYSWTNPPEHHPYYPYFEQGFPLLKVVELKESPAIPWGDAQVADSIGDRAEHGGGDRPDPVTYLCAYTLNPTQFILVTANAPLSDLQHYCLEQQAYIIKQHIDALQYHRQHDHKVQLLEQTLHRVEHQLRNPLELICLYTDVLQMDVLHEQCSTEVWEEPIQQISKAAQTIKRHLSRIKGYSQSSTLQLEPCRLDALFADVVDALHPLATEKSVQIECNGSGVEIYVDTWQFKEVLTNLLTNALHFSPPGERIRCRWRVFAREIVIEICDKGPGFSSQDLKKAFTPFYSRRPGGTGLGLTLSRKIVLDHQGSLWAENQPTGGASLHIVLPRSHI